MTIGTEEKYASEWLSLHGLDVEQISNLPASSQLTHIYASKVFGKRSLVARSGKDPLFANTDRAVHNERKLDLFSDI